MSQALTKVAFGASLAILLGIGFFSPPNPKTETAKTETVVKSCKSDWMECKDNEDMANHNETYSNARYACKHEANERAKFGDPEWGWIPFSYFSGGSSYKENGIASLADKDVKFHNMYGAKMRVQVVCKYDLRAEKVLSVTVTE